METSIPPEIKVCPICGNDVDRPRATYCGKTCCRKAEYRRLKPQIYAYHAMHREQIRKKNREWRLANPEKVAATNLRNRDKRIASAKAWKKRNPERTRELRRLSAKRCGVTDGQKRWRAANRSKISGYNKKWASNNKGAVVAKVRRRQAAKLNATPLWLTKEQHQEMTEIYTVANQLGLHVDHIVPLQGKTVCGLHVPWNLQAIPADVNMQKKNKHAA